MQALNIYVQGIEKERFREGNITQYLNEILDKNIPVCLTYCPAREVYSETNPLDNLEILELTKEILDKGGILGQQGFYSRCPNNHLLRDQWHENWCWKNNFSAETQRKFMERGREKLFELTGFVPELYSPPNNYHDKATLEITSKMQYGFFADKAVIPIRPYLFDKMLVVPQGELHKNRIEDRAVVYIHYDQIYAHEENYTKIIQDAISMRDLKPEEVSEKEKRRNDRLKYNEKFIRDVVGMPKRFVRNVLKVR